MDFLISAMLCILLFIFAVGVILLMVRGHIVSKNMKRALKIINKQGDYFKFQELCARYRIPYCYDSLAIDISKWSFDDMFPGLKDLDK